MKNSTMITLSLVSTTIITASAAVAFAEPNAATSARYPGIENAIENAIELAFATGYADGAGDIDNSNDVGDLAGGGAHVEMQVGYRITPNLALRLYGSITDHSDGDMLTGGNSEVFTATTGWMSTWHFRPETQVDPWLSAGAGVRYLKVDAPGSSEDRDLFGIDAARLQAGVDFRLSPMFSIGPVVGATLTKFVWDQRMDGEWNEIEDRDLNFHVHAGLMGRFSGPLD